MSRNSKNAKKSTSKYRKFKVSPLIPVIAVVEAVVLLVVSTYAWFYLTSDKEVSIGTISVDADSGLDIDFKYAKEEDYINLWNYIDKDFKFEPVTSLDGRNVFVPTSGTFDKTNTSDIIFREGTVNDINSKYINIDFELTNTTDYNMKVYLNNNSYFHVKDKSGNQEESRALRLAFYPNDGSVGKVNSQLINENDSSGNEEVVDTSSLNTIYFDNTKDWSNVYIHMWNRNGGTDTDFTSWPGAQMTRVSGTVYAYSYSNGDVTPNMLMFHDGSGNKTSDTSLTVGSLYTPTGSSSPYTASSGTYNTKTFYFVKPDAWDNVYVHGWRGTSSNPIHYTSWNTSGDVSGLDEMKYVGSGVYSYTCATDVSGVLFTNGYYGGNTQTENLNDPANDTVYYISGWGTGSSGKDRVSSYSTHTYSNLTNKTVYFYNSLNWTKPYAVGVIGNSTIEIPMTTLSGNVYYCNVPEIYSQIYFHQKESSTLRTKTITHQNGYVYRTLNETDSTDHNYYKYNEFLYSNYIDASGATGYAVISPGVSTGFQRTYTPVVSIDNETGHVGEVVPAFSNSIDNYIFGNNAGVNGTSQTVFEIDSRHVLSLSMVIWLEGTDPACSGDVYPGSNIELRLEFASSYTDTSVTPPEVHNVNTYGSETYTYKFYDRTLEVWTSDRQSTESGVTVAPVMQLYDNTIKRGYLMSPDGYTTVDGKTKVSVWTVDAPQNIALWGHDIIFRRVNPYDEDEVWNYWHAGRVAGSDSDTVYTDRKTNTSTIPYSVYSEAKNGDVISFTAFADGSPTAEVFAATYQRNNPSATAAEALAAGQAEAVAAGIGSGSGSSYKEAPSCGGLWGNHKIRTMTLVDALQGHPCKESNGILTMKYTYTYSAAGTGHNRTVTTEYKASGPYNDVLYYFIVPDAAYTTSASITFNNYTGYNADGVMYAINSDRNNQMWFNGSYSGGTISGDYFELNEQRDHTANNYWGSDILYVSTTNSTSDYCFSGNDKGAGKNKLMQVHYYGYQDNSSDTRMYSYLYAVENDDLKNGATTVFVSVVPNNYRYYQYRVEVCDWDDPSNDTKKYYMSSNGSIYHKDSETYNEPDISISYNGGAATFRRNHLNNLNVCKLDYVQDITIYFQTYNSDIHRNDNPYIYLYKGGDNNSWPGKLMTWVSGNNGQTKKYKYIFNPSQYDTAIFNGGDNTKQTNPITIDLTCNNDVWECNSVNANPGHPSGFTDSNDNGVLHSVTEATTFAHYAARS